MTYDHTPIFIRSKTSTQKTKTKNPSSGFCRVWFFRSDRSRSTVRVDRRAQIVHVHVGRPLGSTGHLAVLSVCLGRPGRSTVVPQRSKIWPLAVDRPGRPAAVRNSDRLQQLYFLTDFVGISPQRISLAVLPCFSTPINSGSLQHDKTPIFHNNFHINSFKLLSEKRFSKPKFSYTHLKPIPLLHSRYLHYTIPKFYIYILVIGLC